MLSKRFTDFKKEPLTIGFLTFIETQTYEAEP